MSTGDYALGIALISAGISLASLSWNVWSKFIHTKPSIKVSFSRMTTIYADGTPGDRALCLSATNMGPGQVILYAAVCCKRWKWQRETVGMINRINNFPKKPYTSNGPFSGGLPKKLDVGETFSAYFPRDCDWATDAKIEELPYAGFSDTFNRIHLTKLTLDSERFVAKPLIRALRYVDKKRAAMMKWLRTQGLRSLSFRCEKRQD